MAEVIDNEARERVAELDKRFMELSTDYWGPNRDNGTRSMVREHDAELENIKAEYRHYLDTLPERCLGLKGLAEYEAREGTLLDETRKEDKDMTIAEGNNKVKRHEVRLNFIGLVVVALLTLVGQVVNAQMNARTQKQLVVLTYALENQTRP